MSRSDELRARDARLADKLGLERKELDETGGDSNSMRGRKKLLLVILLVLMLLGLALAAMLIVKGHNTDERLSEAAQVTVECSSIPGR